MATKKSGSTVKKAAAKKAPAKKTTVKKAPVKKNTSVKRPVKKSTKNAAVQSFRLSKDTQSFITTSITRQTVYWAVFAVIILIVGIYILNIQLDILETLEEIERSAAFPIEP